MVPERLLKRISGWPELLYEGTFERFPLNEVAPNHDRYDFYFVLVLVLGVTSIVVLSVFLQGVTSSHALVLIAIITAVAAIYQLRHSKTEMPTVRQDFRPCDECNRLDFGLRNLGPGPALYFQVFARIDGEATGGVDLKPLKRPIHLPENGFLGLVHDPRLDDGDRLGEEALDEGEEVELYYSYLSTDGTREPRELIGKEDDECLKNELTGDDQNPRTMECKRIKDNCFQ